MEAVPAQATGQKCCSCCSAANLAARMPRSINGRPRAPILHVEGLNRCHFHARLRVQRPGMPHGDGAFFPARLLLPALAI